MTPKRMTLKEVLDIVATEDSPGSNSYTCREATLVLNHGFRAVHRFVFDHATKTGKRWFEHCGIDDVWEKVSEKRLMEWYGKGIWFLHEEAA